MPASSGVETLIVGSMVIGDGWTFWIAVPFMPWRNSLSRTRDRPSAAASVEETIRPPMAERMEMVWISGEPGQHPGEERGEKEVRAPAPGVGRVGRAEDRRVPLHLREPGKGLGLPDLLLHPPIQCRHLDRGYRADAVHLLPPRAAREKPEAEDGATPRSVGLGALGTLTKPFRYG